MSEESKPRRWRDDPLSVFLAVAAVLLAGMYFLEERQVSQLRDATRRAQELGAGALNFAGCFTHAAGPEGRVLVVQCDRNADAIAQDAAAHRDAMSRFDEMVFVGTDRQLVCSRQNSKWPTDCVARPNPEPKKAEKR